MPLLKVQENIKIYLVIAGTFLDPAELVCQ